MSEEQNDSVVEPVESVGEPVQEQPQNGNVIDRLLHRDPSTEVAAPASADEQANYNAMLEDRKAKGLCVNCGNDLDENGVCGNCGYTKPTVV